MGEIAEIIPGYAFKSSDFGHGKNIAIKIKDIVPPGIDIKNADTVDVHPGERYQLQSGDYVMAMTGATIGKLVRLVMARNVSSLINECVNLLPTIYVIKSIFIMC